MATVCAHLPTPVTATVTKSFGSFHEGQRVEINRVTSRALWFGVIGRPESLPCLNVDEGARQAVRLQYEALMNEKTSGSPGQQKKGTATSK